MIVFKQDVSGKGEEETGEGDGDGSCPIRPFYTRAAPYEVNPLGVRGVDFLGVGLKDGA